MSIIRGHHISDDEFTLIPNRYVRDKNLSLAAIGLLTQLYSHKEGWRVSQESLARANGIGRDAMRTILNELMKAGYLVRSEARERNEAGQLAGYTYTTKDPEAAPQVAEPMLDEPTLDEPTQADPTLKKNIESEEQVKEKHTKDNDLFEEFWNAYPRKLDKAKAFRAFKSALKRTKFEDILAGVIAYRNDPKRNPDFTKYPATWLNNDSWENAANSPEGTVAADERKRREREASERYLAEMREQEKLAAPAPKCEHGKTIALCNICVKKLS